MPRYEIKSDREGEQTVRGLLRQFAISIAALAAIVIVSTLGLVLFGRHEESPLGERLHLAFWDTLNLISTVGSLEEEFTRGQRAWAMLIIIFGLGAALYAFGNLQGMIQGGDVRRYFSRRRIQRMLESKRGHVVLCGYGHVGRVVARRMHLARKDLVVIDLDDDAVGEADAAGHTVIHADCTSEAALREAGLDRASGLIATLNTDAANVYMILIARELNPDLRIVSRAEREASRHTMRQAGADRVIVPDDIAGMQLSHLVLQPRMSDFLEDAIGEGEFDFTEIDVSEFPALEGRTLGELNLPVSAEVIVIAVIAGDGTKEFNPSADRVLAHDDTVLAVSHGESLQRLREIST